MSGFESGIALERQWVEVREEGDDEHLVFRPIDYPVPPARGRRWLDLRGGEARVSQPGPDDRPLPGATGRWQWHEDRLDIHTSDWEGHYRIERLESDLLVLRMLEPGLDPQLDPGRARP